MVEFLSALYPPPDEIVYPESDEQIVCRCEEVSLGDIKGALRHERGGLNGVKSSSRCGMGSCQGRFCGLTLLHTVARETGEAPGDVEYLRLRPPVKPVSLVEMSTFNDRDL